MRYRTIRMSKIIVCSLILFFLCPIPAIAASGKTQSEIHRHETGLPFIRNYSPKECRQHDQNWAIIQDLRGVMYFGNSSGLLEYDGASWRLIQMPNASTVRSLARDQIGRIYVGAVGEFGYMAPDSIGQMRFVSLLNLVPSPDRTFVDVWRTHVAPEGVYFQTSTQLFRYLPERSLIKVWKPGTSFQLSFLVRGRLYIRQREFGLQQMVTVDSPAGDSLRLVYGEERLAQENISFMLPYDEKRILLGTRTQGLFLYDGISCQPLNTKIDAFLRGNRLYIGVLLPEGPAWAALATLDGGMAIIDQRGRLLQLLDKGAGLQDNVVYSLFVDRQGAMWLALNSGISRVEMPSPLSHYGEKNGLQGPVMSILRHQGTLYVTTLGGIFYLPSRRVAGVAPTTLQQSHFKPVSGTKTENWGLLSMGKDLLAATSAGLYQVDGDQATLVKASEQRRYESPSYVLYRSQQDTNRVYIGLKVGLASLRYDHDASRWIDEGRIAGIQETIRTIVESKDGKLWLGIYPRGLLRLDFTKGTTLQEPKMERFDSQHGLPAGGVHVNATTAHPVFTTDVGLFHFDEETHKFFPDSTFGIEGPRRIGLLTEDRSGNVWLESGPSSGVNGRLSVCLRQADETYVLQRAPFLRAPEGVITAIYPENDGITWFGGSEGLMRYDAHVAKNYELEYPALIRRVTVHEDSIIFGGAGNILNPPSKRDLQNSPIEGGLRGVSLPYAYNALRFEFAAPSFDAESENQFQTYLEEFDKDWSPWNKETRRDYTNLPEGEYRFRVRARNVYEHESSEGIYAFKILPPWYRSWWAYGCYGIILGILLLSIRQYEIRKQKEKAENRRQAKELEEARQLQLSMLPKEVPQLPHLDIAAYMKPSSEVGGDYYDFHLDDDGTLTVAIGDATGHGLKSGTMVTAAKSLFTTLANDQDITQIFSRCNQTLRSMNLRGLYMAMLIAKIRAYNMVMSGAGMPPVLFYRSATQQVEEITIKGMPLGGVSEFPYQQQEVTLAPGDIVVLMSDGFPERFNRRDEILDYEKAKTVLAQVARQSPSEIIEHFVKIGEAWADGRAQNDDVTFVVLKVKG